MSELKRGLFEDPLDESSGDESHHDDVARDDVARDDVARDDVARDDVAVTGVTPEPDVAGGRPRRGSRDMDTSPAGSFPAAASEARQSRRGHPRHVRAKKRRRLTLAVLPTLLTLGNGVCGLAAIAVAMSVTLDWPVDQKLFAAGILIFAGMLFDALDGSAARMTGQGSQFGAELDSLCDAITFGTAPAVIVWRISDALPQRLTWAIGVLFALCVLIRLARFNVETTEDDAHEGFDGLPSPAAAGTLAAFAIAMPDLASAAVEPTYPDFVRWIAQHLLEGSHYFIPVLALVLAFLMVSRFQYPHIVQQWVRGRRTPHQIGQALFALASIFLLHWLALPVAFCYFAFASPIRSWRERFRDRGALPPPG